MAARRTFTRSRGRSMRPGRRSRTIVWRQLRRPTIGLIPRTEAPVIHRFDIPEDATVLRVFWTMRMWPGALDTSTEQGQLVALAVLPYQRTINEGATFTTSDPLPGLNVAGGAAPGRFILHKWVAVRTMVSPAEDTLSVDANPTVEMDSRSKARMDSNHNFLYFVADARFGTGGFDLNYISGARILLMIP